MDLNCPYCGYEQEICHDDGYGYGDDVYEQECVECEKVFQFTTYTHFIYTAFCNGDHQWESWAPEFDNMEGCSRCDAARKVDVWDRRAQEETC